MPIGNCFRGEYLALQKSDISPQRFAPPLQPEFPPNSVLARSYSTGNSYLPRKCKPLVRDECCHMYVFEVPSNIPSANGNGFPSKCIGIQPRKRKPFWHGDFGIKIYFAST